MTTSSNRPRAAKSGTLAEGGLDFCSAARETGEAFRAALKALASACNMGWRPRLRKGRAE